VWIDLVFYFLIGFGVALLWNARAVERKRRFRRVLLPLVWIFWPFYLIGLMGWYLYKTAAQP
jgi:hypothetical protein